MSTYFHDWNGRYGPHNPPPPPPWRWGPASLYWLALGLTAIILAIIL